MQERRGENARRRKGERPEAVCFSRKSKAARLTLHPADLIMDPMRQNGRYLGLGGSVRQKVL